MGSRCSHFCEEEIMNNRPAPATSDTTLNLFWIAIGFFFLWFAGNIPEADFTSAGDPGPRFFPQCLGTLLLLGGIYWLLRPVFGLPPAAGSTTLTQSDQNESVSHTRRPLNGLLVLIAITLYIPAVSWLGFSLSTLLLTTSLLRFLGSRWSVSLGVACTLIALVQLLFGYAFNVPLPTNYWGLVLPGGIPF